MIKVYAITLALCVVGLLIVIFGTAFSENTGGRFPDPGAKIGHRGKILLGALSGFAMGGMAAEFSPLDLSWQLSFVVALVGLAVGAVWTRYAVNLADE